MVRKNIYLFNKMKFMQRGKYLLYALNIVLRFRKGRLLLKIVILSCPYGLIYGYSLRKDLLPLHFIPTINPALSERAPASKMPENINFILFFRDMLVSKRK